MDAHVREMLDLVVRWVHLIAGIMWIGNSMLFNWLDRNLIKPENAPPGNEGIIWMVHSGGFYEVEKKQLEPNEMPAVLHWFKWQNGFTWISGICLLVIVYYMGGGAFLVDPTVSSIGVGAAVGIGVGAIVVSWAFYDLVWKSPLGKQAALGAAVCLLYLGGVAYGLTHVLSGRAAYIHVGVILGTLMTGNVWMVILPSQRELIAMTKAGKVQDSVLAKRAKQRSIHNNYMTFPLLFIMISNHFPSTYGSSVNWIVLGVVMVAGAGVRHFMNIRFWFAKWVPAFFGTAFAGVIAIYVLTMPKKTTRLAGPESPPVAFKTVRSVIGQRCVACHSMAPTDEVWKTAPNGVMFDSPEQMARMAPRIKDRVVISRTMPLGNKTGMTDAEREMIGDWIDQGAKTE